MDRPDPTPRPLLVLFGGRSAEHEVSRVTAAHVLAAIDRHRYEVGLVGIDTDGRWHRVDPPASPVTALEVIGPVVQPSVVLDAYAARSPAAVVVPLLHGPHGEDGTVQGLLELADLAYVGSGVLGSALAMDKAMAKTVLTAHGIPQVAYRVLHLGRWETDPAGVVAELIADLGLPCFVKPSNMGSSVGVSRVDREADLSPAIGTALQYDEWVVVEEAVTAREIEVAVLGDLERPRPSLPGEVVPADEFYSYADKYLDGAATLHVPARLDAAATAAVQDLACAVFRALRCDGLARVDFFYESPGRGWLCSEANTMPGFTPISMFPALWTASGLAYPALVEELIASALRRAARRRRAVDRVPTSRGERRAQEGAQLGT